MKIVLAGSSGFIGKCLLDRLYKEQHELILLTRNPKKTDLFIEKITWDGENLGDWTKCIDGADAVINLSGAGIADKKWSHKRKKEILESRVNTTRAIVSAINASENSPSVLINASAIGYYGAVEKDTVGESYQKGAGFLADVCEKWEMEVKDAEQAGTRVVVLRTGVVLEKGGGAIEKMLPPFLIFAGGPLGSGKQWFPWIHRDDVINIILFCLRNETISAPVNVTAPNPLTNKEFSKALGKAIHRPSWAPVPGFMLQLLLGEMSEMLLTGAKVIPQKLLNAGFKFQYEEADHALEAIFK